MLSREKLKIERNFESVTKSKKNNDMKEGDLILVSAEEQQKYLSNDERI